MKSNIISLLFIISVIREICCKYYIYSFFFTENTQNHLMFAKYWTLSRQFQNKKYIWWIGIWIW